MDRKVHMLNGKDLHSGYIFSYPIRHKSEAEGKIIHIKNKIEKLTNHKVLRIHFDQGGEFISIPLDDVQLTYAPKGESASNPHSERLNQTITAGIRVLLHAANLSHKYWSFAAQHYAYSYNAISHKKDVKPPIEQLFNMDPEELLRHLKVFGCKVIYHDPKHTKVAPRGSIGINLGWDFGDQYNVLLPSGRIIRCRNLSKRYDHE